MIGIAYFARRTAVAALIGVLFGFPAMAALAVSLDDSNATPPSQPRAKPAAAGDAGTSSAVATGEEGGLAEITVTAQRRVERLQDVPVSVAAFGQVKLDQQGLRNIDDLSRLSPSVTFIRNGANVSGDEDSDISIRGIDSTAGAATVGIYVDDTPIQTRHLQFASVSPFPALFDLDRIEVLRGPQGTLFGAGSEGGTIRFLTPEPSLTTDSVYARSKFAQIQGGGTNWEAGAAAGGPIIDGVLGFRISASYRSDGGWVDRVNYTRPPSVVAPDGATLYTEEPTYAGTTESNANWRDTTTFRAALKWAPTDNLTVSPSVYVQTLHINDTAAYWLSLSSPSRGEFRNGNAQRDPTTDPWYLAAIKVDWDAPIAHLTSNTSYFSRSQHSATDYSQYDDAQFLFNQYPPVGDEATSYFKDRQDNFTQEARLISTNPNARFTWAGGVFYSHTHESTSQIIVDPYFAQTLGLPPQPGGVAYSNPQFGVIDKQAAGFGEINYKLTDTLKFTAGLRASKLQFTGLV